MSISDMVVWVISSFGMLNAMLNQPLVSGDAERCFE